MISNFFSKSKLSGNVGKISAALTQIFTHKKLDDEMLEQLEETLLLSDMGGEITSEIISHYGHKNFLKLLTKQKLKIFSRQKLLKF